MKDKLGLKSLAIISFVINLFTLASCQSKQNVESKIELFGLKDSLQHQLLLQSLNVDSLEYCNDSDPFLFFKSGYLIDANEKHALVVYLNADSLYHVSLYSLQNNDFKLVDSIDSLDSNPLQFAAIFRDYNFDDQTDIYIQSTTSNGWSLSKGHLIIIDPESKKFRYYKEAGALANLSPDERTKTLKAEELNDGDTIGLSLNVRAYSWVNDQLREIDSVKISKNK